jgi:hypothetical protein
MRRSPTQKRAAEPDGGRLSVGYMPFSWSQAARIAEDLKSSRPDLELRLHEDVTPELLRLVAAHELSAAAVLETPAATRHHRVRIDALRDEPLLAALPASHRYANADAVPIAAFVADRVLLPRESEGHVFNSWLRAVVRAVGHNIERTLETPSAPWDRRMLPVADGEAVSVLVGEWTNGSIPGVSVVSFDPPLSMPIDLASSPTGGGELLASAARRLRDAECWLTHRPASVELPTD